MRLLLGFGSGILLVSTAACGPIASTRPPVSNATINAFITAGKTAQAKGEPLRAQALYTQAITDDPKSAIALYDLGDLEQVSTDNDLGAARNYRKALAIDPKFVDALFNLAILETNNKPQASISNYEKVTSLDPHDADAYLNLGYALLGVDRTAAGDRALRRAVALDPSLKSRISASLFAK